MPFLLGLFAFTTVFLSIAKAQTDTTFWFAVPEVASGHADRPIFLRFTSQGLASQVTISLPAAPGFVPLQVNVPANGVSSINLTDYIDQLENVTSNTVAQKGLLVESTAPITAYYEVNPTNNPDIFSLKGKTALGTSFMIPGQDFMRNGNGKNAFDIVATENNTTITITPTKALEGGRAANVAFSFTLNKGETFSCRALGTTIADKLTGSTVTADKPIAITLIDDSVRGGEIYSGSCRDLLGDQLIPISALGQEFIVQRGFLNVNTTAERTERVIVMAIENGTSIYVDGNAAAVSSINAGETYHRRMGSDVAVTHIWTDKPVYVIHITGFGCETGMAVIPAISCTGSALVGFRRSTAEQFGITVTTRTVHVNAFTLNNTAFPIAFNVVPGTNSEWSYARISRALNDTSDFNLSTGYILANSSGNFHLGIINGGSSSGCRYGYFSGFAQVNVKATSNSTVEAPACQASPVYIEADSIYKATYSWSGPNGFNTTDRVINFPQVTFADTGLYTVTATVDNCISRIDSINIVIKPRPNQAQASNDGPDYCHGSTIHLFAATVAGVTYHWMGPNGFTSSLQNPVIAPAEFLNGGTYRLITELDGCSSDTTFTRVYVYPRPVITPLSAVEFCRYDSVTLVTGGGVSYEWYKNDTLISGVNDSFYVVWGAGDYHAVVTNEFDCRDTADAIAVTVFPLPNKQLGIVGDTSFCVGGSVRLFTEGGYQYTWLRDGVVLPGEVDSFVVVHASGSYKVVVTSADSCVDSSQSVVVTASAYPTAGLTATRDSICAVESSLLTATGGDSYAWLHQGTLLAGEDSAVLTVFSAGDYQAIVYNAVGCADTSAVITVVVNALPVAAIDSNGLLAFCAGDSVVLASMSSAAGFEWLKDGVSISTDSAISVATAGTYQLVLTNSFGCVDSSEAVLVIINPLPVASIDSNGSLTFCAGDSVGLASASSATGYSWLKDGISISTDSAISVTTAGTYQLVLTNSFGCVDSSEAVSVIVNPLPVAAIDSNGSLTFCAGDSVVLASTSSAAGYNWLKDGVFVSSDSSYTVSAAGTYQLILTNSFGCVDSSEAVSVIVNPLPVAAIDSNGSLTFCAGDSVMLASVGSAAGYDWLKDGVSVSTDSAISVATAGTYQLVLTNSFGCVDSSETVLVIVNPLPTAAIDSNGSLTFCAGDSVVLASAGSAAGYDWLKDGVSVSNDSAITVSAAGTYQLILINSFGCVDSSEAVSVIVNPLPVAAIDSNGSLTFCAGDSVGLASTSSAAGYNWLKDGIFISTDSAISVSAAGTYQLILTNSFGCVDSSEAVSVIVNPLPVAAIDSNGSLSFCAGDSVKLASTSAAASFEWLKDGISISNDSAITVSAAGTYQLTLTNSFGCVDSSEVVSVIVNPLPFAAIDSNGSLTFCDGDSVVLASASSAIGYSWLKDGVFISTDSAISVATAGTYQLVLTNSFGCVDSSEAVSVIVNPLPVAAIDSNGSLTFCAGNSVVLASTSSVAGYNWLKDGISVSTDSSIIVSAGGTYQLILINSFGCMDSSEVVSVIVNPLPVAAIDSNGSLSFCAGDSVGLASTSSALSYNWLKDGISVSTDSSISVSAAGTYQLILTNSFSCVDSSEAVSVIVNPLPVAAIDSNGSLSFCAGDSVGLASTSSAAGYNWLKDGISISNDSAILVATAGTYQLVLTNSFGCVDSSEAVSVIVNPLPVAAIDSNGSLTFCAGDSVMLASAGSAAGFLWLKDGVSISTDSSISVSAAGTYQLILTNSFGCVDSSEVVSVIVNPLPVATIDSNGSLTFCAGDSVGLASTSSAAGYIWLKDGASVSTDSAISVSTAGTYQLILTNSFGCVDSSEVISVIVNPLPVAAIDSNGSLTFCAGDSVMLASTSSAAGFRWLKDGVSISTDSSISVSAAGTYQLILTNSFGCVDSSEAVLVIVNPLPVADIDSNGSLAFCAGDSVMLASAGSAAGFEWLKDGVSISTDSAISVATAGTYQLILTNSFGCVDSSEAVSVIVNPLPVAAIDSNGSLTFCAGDSVKLASTSAATSFEWLKDGISFSTDSAISVATAGTYQLILTNSFGCVDSSEAVSVIVNPLPVAAIDSNGSLTFCAGDSVMLASVGSAIGYSWLKDGISISNDSAILVATAGTYQLVLTNSFGCVDSSEAVSVIVNPLPVASIDSNGSLTFCAGDSVGLASASSATGYSWLKDGISISTDSAISVATAGTYQLVLTNSFGCVDSSGAVSVIVNPLPVAAIDSNGSLTFCAGDSVGLASTSSAAGYSWLKDGVFVSSDSSYTVSAAGTYQLILTNSFGCVDSSEAVLVIVNPLPVAAIDSNGSLTFCVGDSVVLASAGSAAGYNWLKDGISISNDSAITVSAAGTYQLILTNSFGCVDSSEAVSVIVNPLPVAAIDSNGSLTFCAGDSVVLASTGSAAGYDWLKDGVSVSTDSAISVAMTGVYQLILTNSFGCVDSSEAVSVIVNPLPVAAIDSNGSLSFCAGDSVVIASAGSAAGYDWLKDGVSVSNDSAITVSAAGTYQLILTNSFGCIDSSEAVLVIVNPLPVAAIDSNGSLTFCAGDSVVLASTSSAAGYNWLKDGVSVSSDSAISVTTAGTYQLVLTNSFGCIDSSEAVSVIVNPLPVAAIDSNGSLSFCAGDSVVLASTSSAAGYSWLKDGVSISTDSSISVSAAGTYQLILTNSFGCVDSSEVVSVIVNPLPFAAIDSNGSLTFCDGDSVVLASASSAIGYSWLKDGVFISTDSAISVATAGTYQLVLTNSFGCVDSSGAVSVIVNPLPVAAIDSNGSLSFCAGDSVVLASTSSAAGYSWLKDGVFVSSDSSYTVSAAGTYQLILTNSFGCVDSSEAVLVIINPLPVASIDSNGSLTFCAGDSVGLASASSATGYSWLKDGISISTDSAISVATAGTYQLVLTNSFGCVDSSGAVSVIVNPLPIAVIDSNGSLTFCAGDSVVLASAGSAAGYNWLKDGISISTDSAISVATAGTYQLVLTNSFGCVDSSGAVSVIVNPLPIAVIDSNGSLTFCAGDSVVLASAGSAAGYNWLKDGASVSTDSAISVSAAGTYQLILSNSFGCVDSSEAVLVIVNPLPVAAIDSNGSLTFCAGDSVVLASTSSAAGYSWLKDGVFVSSDSSYTVSTAGTYQLILTNSFGCVDSSEAVSVIVNPLPVAAIDSNGSLTFCAGDSVMLASVGSATGFRWLKDGISVSNDSAITVSAAGTYQLILTNSFGCVDSSEVVSVIVNPLPVAAIDSNGSLAFCAGDSVVLASTSSAAGYNWLMDGVSVSTDSAISVAMTGTYQLILTNSFGCMDSSETVLVIVNPLPVAAIDSNGSLTFCAGDSVVLASAGSAAGFEWLKDGVSISNDSAISVATAGTYQLVLTNSFGCVDSSEAVSVIVNPLPIAVIDSNGSLTFCAGDSVVLASASSAAGYIWLKDGASVSTDSAISVSAAGTYQLILTNSFGCIDSSEVVAVIVNPLPVAAIDSNGSLTFCAGDSVGLASTSSAAGYIWLKDGASVSTDSSISVSTAGTYQLILTNSFGCVDSSEVISVIVNPLPVAAIDSNGSLTFCAGDSVMLASTSSAAGFRWLKDGVSISTDSSISVSAAGTYQLILTNSFGCVDSSEAVLVIVNPLPVAAIDSNGSPIFCAGDSVMLASAGSAAGFEWLKDGVSISTDSAISVATAGTYQLILTNSFGCVDSSEAVSVIVNPLPVAAIDSNRSLTFCAGDSVVLASASSATGYSWLKDGVSVSTDSSISVSAAGAYQLIITNSFGCIDSSEVVSVIENPLPVAAIDSNGSLTFCAGDSVVLASVGSAAGYNWLKDGISVSNDAAISVSAAGTYQLILTNSFGCADSSEVVSVVVNPLPAAAIDSNGSLTFCAGDSVVLASVGSAAGYNWLKDGVFVSSDSSFAVSTAGTYQLIITNSFGCVDSSEAVSVIVNSLPVAAIDSNGSLTFCAGDSVKLASTSAAASFEWLKDGLSISTDSAISVSAAGTYQLILTNSFGCLDSSRTVSVIVNPLPVAAIDSNGSLTFCAGDSVMLASASSAAGFRWLKDGVSVSTDSSISVSTAGTYQLILTNSFGCVDSSTAFQVTVNPLPQPVITVAGNLVFCQDDSIQLYTSGGIAYQWFENGVAITGATDSFVVVNSSANWTVQVTNAFGCSNLSPSINTNRINPPLNFNVRASNLIKCVQDTVIIETSFSPLATYQWLFNGNLIPGANQYQYLAAQAGEYACQVSYGSSCQITPPSVLIREYALPTNFQLLAPSSICKGETMEIMAPLIPEAQYSWRGPDGFISNMHRPVITDVQQANAGWYYLTLSIPACGDFLDSVFVQVQAGIGEIEITGKRVICGNGDLKLSATAIAGAEYEWLLASGKKFEGSKLDLTQLQAEDGGFVELTINKGSCSSFQRFFVEFFPENIYFPNAFSPNYDGLNDEFVPQTLYEGPYELQIYDRWGKLIFTATQPNQGWNGLINGEEANSGTYTWICMSENCSKQRIVNRGTIQLIK